MALLGGRCGSSGVGAGSFLRRDSRGCRKNVGVLTCGFATYAVAIRVLGGHRGSGPSATHPQSGGKKMYCWDIAVGWREFGWH